MSSPQGTRAFTLIEVLLAVALLALLAGISVGILRDASAAVKVSSTPNEVGDAARLIDTDIQTHTKELYELTVGQSWTPLLGAVGDQSAIRYTRQPCVDCPDGWGRLSVTVNELSLTRFHRFKLEPEVAR